MKIKKQRYRTEGLPSNFFDRNAHIHIDAPYYEDSEQIICNLLMQLEKEGSMVSMDYVNASVACSQRAKYPEVYKAHTPGIKEEQLDFFTSTHVKSRWNAVELINRFGKELSGVKGAVIELEQPVYFLTGAGDEIILQPHDYFESITANEVSLLPLANMSFEIHNYFSLGKDMILPENFRDLNDVAKQLESLGFDLGGLFVFEEGQSFGYATNSFEDYFVNPNKVIAEHLKLKKLLRDSFQQNIEVETLVERVVGIFQIN